MKICVMIPVYNAREYLKECIDSIIHQTRPADEILLVDDGSTDSSGELCDEYARLYKNIKSFHKKNEGLGLTRNYGMEQSAGDYILFIDADDYLDKDYLEVMENKINSSKCDTCKTCFRRIDQYGNISLVNKAEEKLYSGEKILDELLPRMIGSAPDISDAIPMSSCCTMYSLDIIRNNGLKFVSEREFISEDLIFNLEYYSYSQRTLLSDYVGYNYRINTNSLTTKYLKDRFRKSKELVNREIELLKQLSIYEKCRHRVSRQFFLYTRMSIDQLSNAKLSKSEKIKHIAEICDDNFLQQSIEEYPIEKLNLKQRVFLELIKHKKKRMLSILLT